jgi:hypothetical protein
MVVVRRRVGRALSEGLRLRLHARVPQDTAATQAVVARILGVIDVDFGVLGSYN